MLHIHKEVRTAEVMRFKHPHECRKTFSPALMFYYFEYPAVLLLDIHNSNNNHQKKHLRKKAEGPGKGDSMQESKEQRGVSQRGQAPPYIGYQDDKKNDHKAPVLAKLIGLKKKTDQKQGRSCCAYPGGQDRS